MTALHDQSAVELLAAYRSRALSPVAVTRAVLAHIAVWEPHLHATYALDGDQALAQAEASQARWLQGAPCCGESMPGSRICTRPMRSMPTPR